MSTQSKTVFLLDAMALVYRAYYAMLQANLKSLQNEPTGAVYGFVSTLINLMDKFKPDYLAVVFDTDAPTFRHDRFEQYKAQRQPMPDDMPHQIDYIKQIVKAFNIECLEMDGWEADDIIGTLARQADEKGHQVIMVTPDKDYMQLITKNVTMMRPTSKTNSGFEDWDVNKVIEKYGVGPDKVIDIMGLMGDSVDNIPGVPGIGEKTAIKLIGEHGSIANAIAFAKEQGKSKVYQNLVDHEKEALDSRELVTIETHVPINLDDLDLTIDKPDSEKLVSLFQHLNMRTFRTRAEALLVKGEGDLFGVDGAYVPDNRSIDQDEHLYQIVTEKGKVDAYLSNCGPDHPLCFDFETTHVEAMLAKPIGLALSTSSRSAIYIPMSADDDSDIREKLSWVQPALEDPDIPKIAQNAKYDMLILKQFGINCHPIAFDTMIAAFVLDSNQRVKMDTLAEKYLDYKPIPITDLIGSGRNQLNMKDIEIEKVADYAAEDADITYRLFEKLKAELIPVKGDIYCQNIDFPLVEVLTDMEFEGVHIDRNYLSQLSVEMAEKLKVLELSIYDHAGHSFNINSPKQMAEILFEHLGLPTAKKTKTGYSTDQSVLEGLRYTHPIIVDILDYRQVDKLKSTYVDTLPNLIHPHTGRVHSTFTQTIAATGRLSSNNPNLQNIPIRTDMGREIRKAFIPSSPNHVLLSADYSQIELRIVASMANDTNMIETFKKGADIHSETAGRVFGVPPAEVSRDMRRKAKEVNFGIIYGISAFGLSSRLGIPQGEAKDLITRYFETYPGVKQYMDAVVKKAKQDGYVETLKGRRRYLPDINASNWNVAQNAARIAINTPIQGTAADMIKLAMINIHRWLKQSKLKTKMILQVHDELIFDVPKDELETVKPQIMSWMENALSLSTPIVVEAGEGENWLDAH